MSVLVEGFPSKMFSTLRERARYPRTYFEMCVILDRLIREGRLAVC